jgi:hypothetical protein
VASQGVVKSFDGRVQGPASTSGDDLSDCFLQLGGTCAVMVRGLLGATLKVVLGKFRLCRLRLCHALQARRGSTIRHLGVGTPYLAR